MLDWTWLARIANDMAPDSGPDAARAALGPWVELLRLDQPLHRNALAAAQARFAFRIPDGLTRTAIEEFMGERPSRRDPARLTILAWLRQPSGAWRLLDERAPGLWTVEDLLGFDDWRQPALVRIDRPGGVVCPAAPGAVLLARIVADTAPTSRRATRPVDAPQCLALAPLVLPATLAEPASRLFNARLADERARRSPWCSAEAMAFRHGEDLVLALHQIAWRYAQNLDVTLPPHAPLPPAAERPVRRRAAQTRATPPE
jgi:hypothetical protein